MTRRTFRIGWTFGLGINFNIDLTLKPNSGEFARVHMNSPAIVPAAMVPPGLTLNFRKRTSVSMVEFARIQSATNSDKLSRNSNVRRSSAEKFFSDQLANAGEFAANTG